MPITSPYNTVLTAPVISNGVVSASILIGAGVPTLTASKGTLYINTTGSSTVTRMYINTDGATTWTAVTTVA